MKQQYSPKRLLLLLVAVCLIIAAARGLFAHDQEHHNMEEAMHSYISEVNNDVNYAVEQVYAVQSMIVGANGSYVDLAHVAPILNHGDIYDFIRCIALAPGGVVDQVYPLEGNEDILGINMFDLRYETAEQAIQAQQTGQLSITHPFALPDGELVIASRLPVFLPREDGSYKEWGIVSVALAFPEMLENLRADALREEGYAYRILLIDKQTGGEREVANHNYYNADHYIQSEFSVADNILRIEAAPGQGWFNIGALVGYFAKAFAGIYLWGAVLELIMRWFRRLRIAATTDSLTGLPNRSHGTARINQILSSASFKRGALLFMDIDNFKSVNDAFGHERGDEILRKCGEQLRQLFRKDDVVCRLGGDEFVVFIPFQEDMAFLNEKIESLLRVMRRDVVGNNAIVRISASVGIAIAPKHGTSFDELYRHADEAQYRAKTTGKDRAIFCGQGDFETPAHDLLPDRSNNCILIIDDDFINREVMKNIFSKQYRFQEAENGAQGLERIETSGRNLAAILLDVNMPGMSGMELLTILHDRGIPQRIPVFLITSHDAADVAQEAYELGVMDVITKPVTPFVILRRVQSVIELYQAREELSETVTGQAQKLQENVDTIDALHRSTIEVLASAIEFRDMETGEHITRIYGITKHILTQTEMGRGLTEEEIENIAIGSIMHDVGKIAISDVILNKPGRLTKGEFEIMKQHTVKGAVLMEQLEKMQDHPSYRYAYDIALHHHERWDGRGYPEGLKGDEISIWAQVVAIADVYDALVSDRVYRKAFQPDTVVKMICSNECGVFNPTLVKCFLQVEPEIRSWYEADRQRHGQEDKSSGMDKMRMALTQDTGSRELVDNLLLTAAVKSSYDMIICVNLTRNSFYMIDYDRFQTHCADNDGVFDDLITAGASSIPEPDRQLFINAFSRHALLEAYRQGKKSVHLNHRQYSDDGRLMNVSTSVLFMEDPRNGDIREITLSRYIDEVKTGNPEMTRQ